MSTSTKVSRAYTFKIYHNGVWFNKTNELQMSKCPLDMHPKPLVRVIGRANFCCPN